MVRIYLGERLKVLLNLSIFYKSFEVLIIHLAEKCCRIFGISVLTCTSGCYTHAVSVFVTSLNELDEMCFHLKGIKDILFIVATERFLPLKSLTAAQRAVHGACSSFQLQFQKSIHKSNH